jgi:hypothetical protein
MPATNELDSTTPRALVAGVEIDPVFSAPAARRPLPVGAGPWWWIRNYR